MTLPANIANNLVNDYSSCSLIKIQFNGLTLGLTDAGYDIEHDNTIYLSNGLLLGADQIKQESDPKVLTLNIGLSSVDPTVTALLLANNQIGREVFVKKAYLSQSDGYTIDYVEDIVTGEISGFTNTSNNNESVISLNVANLFGDWQRKSGRVTTNASQQKYYPNDLGMEYASAVQPDLKWGGE